MGNNEKIKNTLLKLYIAGEDKNQHTLNNLKKITNDYFADDVVIEIIDLLKNPKIAIEDRIRVLPQLVRVYPEPEIRLFGDLSDIEKVLSYFKMNTKKEPT